MVHQPVPHRLSRSKLSLSLLVCRLTTPSLKYLSSPAAVLPPIYHFSAPSTSLKPSELESLSLLPLELVIYRPPLSLGDIGPLLGPVPGDLLKGDVECVRGEWREVRAVVVAPAEGFVEVVIVRGCEGDEECVFCVEDGEEVALPCWMAECARKAARKLAKNGR